MLRRHRSTRCIASLDQGDATLRDTMVHVACLRLQIISHELCDDSRDSGCERGTCEHYEQPVTDARYTRRGMSALLEHLDRRSISYSIFRLHRDRDGVRAESGQGLHVRFNSRTRCCNDHQRNPIIGNIDRSGVAEYGISCAPRRQPVDLGADDTIQKIASALGQLKRPNHEAVGPQHDFDVASTEQFGKNRLHCEGHTAVEQVYRLNNRVGFDLLSVVPD